VRCCRGCAPRWAGHDRDPFLLLDEFKSDRPADQIAGAAGGVTGPVEGVVMTTREGSVRVVEDYQRGTFDG